MRKGFFIKSNVAVLASLLCFSGASAAENGRLDPSEKAPLPSFTFAAGEGRSPLSVDDFRGKVVLLNFWATWCGPCVKEMPSLDALQAAYGPQGLVVLPVSRDVTGMLTVKTWLKQHKLPNLKPYWDEGSRGARALNVTALPTSYLIGRDGDVIATVQGDLDWMSGEPRQAVEKALAAGKPEETAAR